MKDFTTSFCFKNHRIFLKISACCCVSYTSEFYIERKDFFLTIFRILLDVFRYRSSMLPTFFNTIVSGLLFSFANMVYLKIPSSAFSKTPC